MRSLFLINFANKRAYFHALYSKQQFSQFMRIIYLFQEYDTIRFRVTLEDEVPTGQQPNIVGVDAYVIVLDENDNPPRFLNVPYEAVAEEDLPVGSTILPGIRVMDPDMLGDTIDLTCVPQPQVSH